MSFECPDCGAEMRLRRSDYGPFFGCSNYPKCKKIVKIKQDYRDLSDEELEEADEDMVILE